MSKHHSHDSLFKFVFSSTSEMRLFLKHFTTEYSKKLDLRTLKNDPTTYINESLQNFYSDIVYSCKTKGEEKIKIAILLEHKSNVPKHPQFQLGQLHTRNLVRGL